MAEKKSHFGSTFFEFLEDLQANNHKQWFNANKNRYIDEVRTPLQQFVLDFAPHLKKISPHFIADPRPIGGSIFRIYRDIRFSKDKTPYKTHAAAQFRHKEGKDVHAPGFYLHLSPGEVFAGFGIWRPDSDALLNIRNTIASKPGEWKKVVQGKNFKSKCSMGGESLKRPPKGFDPDHPFIEDLKRKDFVSQITF
ncbi:MAG: TIGR02453 family protein, partial [Desulfobacterales bacterium]|nr:TIGR02453 family protein [Desulfobacterales bacterium]